MRVELKQVLEGIGWEELYSRHMELRATPNRQGEIRASSPFPYLLDKHPSFSVNVSTGVWHCFVQGIGGDYVMFRALMETEEFDPATGYGIPDYEATQRRLLNEFRITKPIDSDWLRRCREHMLGDPTLLWSIQRRKPWSLEALGDCGVGFDDECARFVIPIRDRQGGLVNAKLYDPNPGRSGPKMIWKETGVGGNYLFPSRAWNEPWLVLVEGETDALTLRSLRIPGASGTAGGGDPVPPGEWWRGKTVFVLTDEDTVGREAAKAAVENMRGLAAAVYKCSLPSWEGMPEKADVSDYVMHLKAAGLQDDAIAAEVMAVLQSGEPVGGEDPDSVQAEDCTFASALTASRLNTKVRFKARILARSAGRYVVPTEYEIRCPGSGQPGCRRCPMHANLGSARFRHEPRKVESLRLVQCDAVKQMQELKAMHGIVKACPEPMMQATKSVDLETCMIGETAHEAGTGHDRVRREAYFLLGQRPAEENKDYELEAFVYAHPKTQQAVFLVTSYRPLANPFEGYRVDATAIERLSRFRPLPGQSPFERIMQVCDDHSEAVTLIKGRRDLHAAYRCVYHSVLSFDLGGERVKRGWLECLVIGDTRCGKSKAFQKLASHYGLGTLVDCKMMTLPGILGSVQPSASGEYYVLAGLLPQNDGGVVCFDEFASAKRDIIGALSSTRAEGVVRINKAASGEFSARVRSIWLANPGQGELMSELPDSGIELIARIIPQPEDIARFDFALSVSQDEVPRHLVNAVYDVPEPMFGEDDCRLLLRWTYSRSPDQVRFSREALSYLVSLSDWLSDRYDPSIPLVEINDQKTRLAKLSVSVAAQVFSTEDGDTIDVRPEHVESAARLLCLWYDKPSMSYDQYSAGLRAERSIRSMDDLETLFETNVAPYGRRLAELLLKQDEIDPRAFRNFVPINHMLADTIAARLNANNCLRPIERGRRQGYRKTSEFTRWLKGYVGSR